MEKIGMMAIVGLTLGILLTLGGAWLIGAAISNYVRFLLEKFYFHLELKKKRALEPYFEDESKFSKETMARSFGKNLRSYKKITIGLAGVISGMLIFLLSGVHVFPKKIIVPQDFTVVADTSKIEKKLDNIHQTLSRGMPEEEMVIRRLDEIIKAIEDMSPTPFVQRDISYVAIIGFCLIGLAVLFLVYSLFKEPEGFSKASRAKMGILAGIVGITLVSVEALNIFNVGEIKLVLPSGKRFEPVQTSVNIEKIAIDWPYEVVQIEGGDKQETILFKYTGSVGPFTPGKSDFKDQNGKENEILRSQFKEIVGNIKNMISRDCRLGFMIIVGRADKRMLKKHLQKEHASNLELAQNRANWVRKCLIDDSALGLEPDRLIPIAAGPVLVGEKGNDKTLESDRFVHCYTFWTKKSEAKTKPATANRQHAN